MLFAMHCTMFIMLTCNVGIRPGFQWSHENASEMMLDYLIDDNNIDIEKHEINLIKDLIAGAPRSKRYSVVTLKLCTSIHLMS